MVMPTVADDARMAGSILEFVDIIDRCQPTEHEGKRERCLHLICPAFPDTVLRQAQATGIGVGAIAKLWDELMVRLGYERYVAQGGDWGSLVTRHTA